MRKIIWLCLLFISAQVFAQELPIPAEMKRAYENGTRDKSGNPGKKYWQNDGNYTVDISFDPATRKVEGVATIKYNNNSPDLLTEIWFKLYANLYKKGVKTKSSIKESDKGAGMQIEAFSLNNKPLSSESYTTDGTNMIVSNVNLAPGQSLEFKIKYHYLLNKGSHVRTGVIDSGAHFVAYSIPRIAVYDDVDGWNKYPYTGSEEFYNDFNDFEINIRVPKNFVVWATGDLTNAKEVFSPAIVDKYRRAEKTGAVIDVIDAADLQAGTVTQNKPFNTFKFEAKKVPDFAFSVSNHYLWKSQSLVVDSTSGRRTRVDAVFNPKHKDYYDVLNFAVKTVSAMSFKFPKWPFPYSHMTVFDGLDQMEYPMMANDNPTSTKEESITLTAHEIFHTMFPFYMGTNETKHAWMDEGWATLGEWLILPMIEPEMVNLYGVEQVAQYSGAAKNTPVTTLTADLQGADGFINSYPKPAFAYLFLIDILGEELFTQSLHQYIRVWQGKHPTPLDFFNSMNEASGKNLNWYWQKWFYETNVVDLSIDLVEKRADGYAITIKNKGNMPLPIDLKITYDDKTQERVFKDAGVWEKIDYIQDVYVATTKRIVKVELGNTHVPDKDKKDNVYLIK